MRAIELHFWMATVGIVLYITALWISGVMEGLMWRAINPDGTLAYTFIESVKAKHPYYIIRLLGGLLYLGGMVVMLWNVIMTARNGKVVNILVPAVKAH
jgi:cytochrome c oxidase cbb3-type subunit 1